MSQTGAHAVGTRIAPADHYHIFARGVESWIGAVKLVIELIAGVSGEEIHRHEDAHGIAIVDREVAPCGGSAAEDHRVKLGTQTLRSPIRVFADADSSFKFDTFFCK